MRFDIATAMTITALLTFGVGASLAFATRRYPDDLRAAIRVWIGGLFVATLALLAVARHGPAPAAAVAVLANTAYALAFAEMGRALAIFAGRARSRVPLLLVGAVAMSSLLFGFVWPHASWRVVVNTPLLVLLQLAVVRAVLGGARGRRPADWLTGALFIACALLTLARGAVELLGPLPARPDLSLVLRDIVFTFSSMLPTLGTLGFMLMCGDRLNDDLARLAMVDPLTGAYNRRTLASLASTAITRARRTRRPLSLLVLDIDHFKQLNDEFGHDVGDEALIGVVARLRAALGVEQSLSRLGGEEFAILLPDVDQDEALRIAEHLRRQVGGTPLALGGCPLVLRVSIGAATLGDDAPDLATLLRHADHALYAAKRGGRDRVVAAASSMPRAHANRLDSGG